jgi:hypothetical protein
MNRRLCGKTHEQKGIQFTCLQVILHMVNDKTLHTHDPQHTFWGHPCHCIEDLRRSVKKTQQFVKVLQGSLLDIVKMVL